MKDGKPTCGYDRLMIKYKALQAELKRVQEERDETYDQFVSALTGEAYLYAHAPFWLKWMYNKKIRKKGKE